MTADFQRAYDAAKAERDGILENRADEDKKLAQLEKIMESLRPLVTDPDSIVAATPIYIDPNLSLANVIRLVLKTCSRFMLPTLIRDTMLASGYDETKQANLLASVHSICKRLVESGEAEAQVSNNKTMYRWNLSRSTGYSGVTTYK